jgi:hypothetical protein
VNLPYARLRIALAAPLLLCGCYRYVPAELGAVPVGQDVRVHLTRQAMIGIEELPDLERPLVSGTLVRLESERLFLRVPVAARQVGFHTDLIGQDVGIPTTGIVQLEQRRLDPLGTGLLVAGTAATAAAVITLILESRRGTEDPGPPPIEELRVPLFSLRFR